MTIRSPLRPPLRQPLRSVFDGGVGGASKPLAEQVIEALGASLVSMRYPTPDFAGLYQDDAGHTPVTAVGQPVGLMLDRRFGLAMGPELNPSNDISAWSPSNANVVLTSTTFTVSSGTLGVTLALPKVGAWYEATVTGSTTASDFSVNTANALVNPTTRRMVGGFGTSRFRADEGFLYLRTTAGVTTITGLALRELPGNHASQATTTARPALRDSPLRIDYDGVDDYLRTVFPALGSSVTIARSIPGVGAQILTGQTIAAGNWDDNVDSCATLVIDRALSGPETSLVTAFLNQQAGV